MTDIKELALRVAKEFTADVSTHDSLVDFAQRLIAAYLAEQEPVGYFHKHQYGDNCVVIENVVDSAKDEEGVFPLYAAPPLPEPARNLYREIYEVWAGSEGIPMPRTAPEAYLLQLLEQMVDIAKTGMNMTEPAPQDSLKEPSSPEHTSSTASDSRPARAAPSSEEVREMVERLRSYSICTVSNNDAADLIERLAGSKP